MNHELMIMHGRKAGFLRIPMDDSLLLQCSVTSGRLNVVKGLKPTYQIVRTEKSKHLNLNVRGDSLSIFIWLDIAVSAVDITLLDFLFSIPRDRYLILLWKSKHFKWTGVPTPDVCFTSVDNPA